MADLSATDRKDFKQLLEKKKDDLIKAINGDLFNDKEQIKNEALAAEGIHQDPDKINDMIREADDDISTIVSEHIEQMQVEKKHKKEDAQRKLKEAMTNLEITYNQSLSELKKQYAEAGQKVDIEYVDFEKKTAQVHAGKQLEKKKELEELKDKISKIIFKVDQEIREKQRMIKKFQFTIQQTITDCYNDAFEKLICANTREQAEQAIQSIPKIWELMRSVNSKEEIIGFIGKMNPEMVKALPAPPPEPVSEMKQAEAISETTEEDVEAEVEQEVQA